jgi:hypothetical protein
MPVTSCQAVVRASWYDIGGRKYLDLQWDEIVNRVKVPFRYNRVMCHVGGLTTVQSIPEGSTVDCVIESTGGYYVLQSIRCVSTLAQGDTLAPVQVDTPSDVQGDTVADTQ